MSEPLYPDLPILIADDEEPILRSLSAILLFHGMNNVITLSDSRAVISTLAKQDVQFAILDLIMPHLSGQELLEMMTSSYSHVPVVIVTAMNDLEVAVECMKKGAFDFIVKPIEEGRLLSATRHAMELRNLRRENELLRKRALPARIENPEAFSAILTSNREMLSIFRYVETISGTSQPVLVTGETGVGKELVARAIHVLSDRPGSFVPVNVAGLDDNLFADTLFGHVKGAYTGADSARKGLIESACHGTLFLDEIGDLSPVSQMKLLRLIQEREYFTLGSDIACRTDARIVLATNRDLNALQETEKFRKDLYYRLCTHNVHIPPLRERLDDLPLLVSHFLDDTCRELGKKKAVLPKAVFAVLGAYHFPGNIRELQALIFDAVSKCSSTVLSLKSFKGVLSQSNQSTFSQVAAMQFGPKLPTIKEGRTLLIREAMRRANNSQSVAAKLLGISRQGLNKYLRTICAD